MKLSLLPDAKIDALESIESFNRLSPELGERFGHELFACFDRIKVDPEHYAENCDGFRAARLNRFRAVVYFRMHENAIFVVRILVNGRDQIPDSAG